MTRNPGQLPRGVDRSHAHHSDSLIDPATDELYVPPVGEQRVRLLGPFRVAHDTPDVKTYPGVEAFQIPVGSVLIDAGWVVDTNFQQSDAQDNLVYWGLTTLNDISDWQDTVSTEATNLVSEATTRRSWIHRLWDMSSASNGGPWLVPDGASVVVYLQDNVTAGEADIYALIAEPAG